MWLGVLEYKVESSHEGDFDVKIEGQIIPHHKTPARLKQDV